MDLDDPLTSSEFERCSNIASCDSFNLVTTRHFMNWQPCCEAISSFEFELCSNSGFVFVAQLIVILLADPTNGNDTPLAHHLQYSQGDNCNELATDRSPTRNHSFVCLSNRTFGDSLQRVPGSWLQKHPTLARRAQGVHKGSPFLGLIAIQPDVFACENSDEPARLANSNELATDRSPMRNHHLSLLTYWTFPFRKFQRTHCYAMSSRSQQPLWRRDGDSNPEALAGLPLFESGSLPFGHPSAGNGRVSSFSDQGGI